MHHTDQRYTGPQGKLTDSGPRERAPWREAESNTCSLRSSICIHLRDRPDMEVEEIESQRPSYVREARSVSKTDEGGAGSWFRGPWEVQNRPNRRRTGDGRV